MLLFKISHKIRFSISSLIHIRKLNVLFYGSDNFSLSSLDKLNKSWKQDNIISDLGVCTAFKKPANLVQVFAEKNKIPLFPWPKSNPDNHYHLGIVVSFSYLIPEPIINSFPMGMINLHASLLPRWRGAAPIIYSLLSGDQTTGVSVMKIRPKHFDLGEIVKQAEIPIGNQILMPELHKKLANLGAELLIDCLKDSGKALLNATPQPKEGITYAPKVEGNSLGLIDWSKMNAKEIYNRYRALHSFRPILTQFQENQIKLVSLEIYNFNVNSHNSLLELSEGEFVYSRSLKSLIVKCAENSFISINTMQIDGKRKMSALDFFNGYIKKTQNPVCKFTLIKL